MTGKRIRNRQYEKAEKGFEPDDKPVKVCLKCDEEFRSLGRHNRVCPRCAIQNHLNREEDFGGIYGVAAGKRGVRAGKS